MQEMHGDSDAGPVYLDPGLSAKRRAQDLVARMTLAEKVSQMSMDSAPIGHLGVPAYDWWSESLHGVGFVDKATVFPHTSRLVFLRTLSREVS